MNCFYHIDTPAVAQCSDCGKFLCKECATKYSPVLCDDCASARKSFVNEENKKEKKFFFISTMVGIVALIYLLILAVRGLLDGTCGLGEAIVQIITGTLGMGGLPYGWIKLNSLGEKFGVILCLPFLGWLIYLFTKFFLATTIGWIFYFMKAKELFFNRAH